MAFSSVGVKEGTDKFIATHEITEDSQSKHIERVAIGTGILELPSSPQVNSVTAAGVYPGTGIDISGKGYIVIKSRFTSSSETISIKLILYDVNDKVIGYSDSETINATDLQEESEYVGDIIIFENRIGVSKIKIKLENDPSSGNSVSFWVAGV